MNKNINISKEYYNIVEKTIRAYLKHFDLKIKNGFIYKGDIAIYTEPLKRRGEVLAFLNGLSIVLDSPDLWNIKLYSSNN